MNILTIIPARKGSKGVPGKNIKLINGKPLINYTFEVVQTLSTPVDIFVSTDDPQVVKLASEYNIDIPILRPTKLAQDKAPMIPVLQHAVAYMEREKAKKYDYILLLQPTAPLRTALDIEESFSIIKNVETDSVISVVQVFSVHPILMKKIENNYLKPFCIEEKEGTRRQDYDPPAYMRNGAIYLTKRDILMQEKSIWGKKITPYIMPAERSASIDDIVDFKVVEYLLANEKT